jgi:hypothetical protein
MLFGENVKWQQANVKKQDLGSRIWDLINLSTILEQYKV